MKRWLAYVRLMRPLELLRLGLLLLVGQYSIVQVGLPAEVNTGGVEVHFYLVLIAVLLIGAAGFVFNDYCDAKRDAEEEGRVVIVGRVVVRRTVLQMHILLSLVGVLCGVGASWRVHNLWLLLLFPMAVGLLWYYSTLYRRQFVIGNLLKGAMVGGCALLPALFEIFYLEVTAWRSFALSEISILPMVVVSAGYALLMGYGTLCVQLLSDQHNFVRGTHREKDTLAFRYGTFTAKLATGGALIVNFGVSVAFLILLQKYYVLCPLGWQSILCGVLLIGAPNLTSLMALLAAQQESHFRVAKIVGEVGLFGVLLLPAFLRIIA